MEKQLERTSIDLAVEKKRSKSLQVGIYYLLWVTNMTESETPTSILKLKQIED